jgi:hypothetical protein
MDKKILYSILHGKSCVERVDNVIGTWGQDVDIVFYSDYDNLEKKVYKVTDKKGYWDLEEKHINGFKFINDKFGDYEWYFFCDDDTFVNTTEVYNFLNFCNEDIVYGYLINCWSKNTSLFYHSGGAGVLISKKIMNKISEEIDVKGTKFADVTLGLFLYENNIKTENNNLFKSETPEHYKISKNEIKKYITFHHIKTFEQMDSLYKICKI